MPRFTPLRQVDDIFREGDLPDLSGFYAFWWMAAKGELLAGHRHIVAKGMGGKRFDVEFKDWWPARLAHPCLYVGKTTNIKNRFSLHIKRNCPDRLHKAHRDNAKPKPVTISCQLHFGIEHVFPTVPNPLDIIRRAVGFSYAMFEEDAIAERFFEEDRCIGLWRPWFNIDSQR